jgi:hypothetical protein
MFSSLSAIPRLPDQPFVDSCLFAVLLVDLILLVGLAFPTSAPCQIHQATVAKREVFEDAPTRRAGEPRKPALYT